MTEQPAPPVTLPPPHESLIEHAESWFRDHRGQLGADAALVAEELKPLLAGHTSGVFALAARVLADPSLKVIASDVLDLVMSAAQIAGVAL
jgi:hypothetical protein